jgi:hypothetical protein
MNFLTSGVTILFSKRALIHGVSSGVQYLVFMTLQASSKYGYLSNAQVLAVSDKSTETSVISPSEGCWPVHSHQFGRLSNSKSFSAHE